MKKILSAALAALMVSSSVLCAGLTASAAEETSVRPQYGTAVALRHEGGFAWYEMEGKTSKTAEPGDCLFSYGDEAIELDGYIDEAEWGSPTLMLDPEYMATKGSNTPTSDNAYFWTSGTDKYVAPITAKVWFRWDDKYMYIAAIVTDPDGQLNLKNGQDTWDGDALQFRIDPLGPNSGVPAGEKYVARPSEYVDGVLQPVYKQPWANTIVKNPLGAAIESYSAVGNFGIAFTTKPSTGSLGKCSIYDMGLRYDPTVEPVKESDGTPVLDEDGNQKYETVYKGKDMYPGTGNPNGDTYASVKSYNNRHDEYKLRIDTHYEVAIPWTQVGENFAPTIGHELGMSFGIVNAAYGATYNNSWLSWGSGIFGKQIADAADACGGSNCVVLSGDDEFSIECDHTNWNYPTCEEGYVCADCGTVERGFIAGHVYDFSNGASPTATTNGTITADCSVCGDHQDIVIPAKPAKMLAAYNQDSTSLPSGMSSYNIDFTNSRNPNDKTPLVDANGNKLTSLTQTYEGFKVIDGTYPSIGTYFGYDKGVDMYNRYKGDDSQFDGSYAVSYDFNIQASGLPAYNQPWTDENGKEDPTESDYRNGIWHWFGGKGGTGYMAGYFPAEDKVYIMEYYGDNIYEGKDAHPIAESEKLGINFKEWHRMRFEYDSVNQCVFVYMDGELVSYAWHDGFASDKEDNITCLHRLMDLSAYFKDIEYTTMSYGHDSGTPAPVEYTVTVDGVASTYAAGETVTLTAPAVTEDENGYFHRFYQWTVNSGDVTIDGDSFVMPEGDVEIVADTVIIGDVDGAGSINTRDLLSLKRAQIGVATLSDKEFAAADINNDGRINASDIALLKRLSVKNFTPVR